MRRFSLCAPPNGSRWSGCCGRRSSLRSHRGAREHLEALATEPRPAAGAAEERARRYCRDALREVGFTVAEETFEYSMIPGRWATPVAGVLSAAILALAAVFGLRDQPAAALATLVVGGGVLIGMALWLARRGVLEFSWARARSVNLVAVRGNPSAWLVAHLDSKSQPVPIAVRALGVTGLIAKFAVATGIAIAQLTGATAQVLWPWMAGVGIVFAAPVAMSVVRSHSPGAVDNASGVAAVLEAAAAYPRALGVLLTSAEELGLAGSRAWCRDRASGIAINFDGLDDKGVLRCTYTPRRPDALIAAMERAAAAEGTALRVGTLVPGVLLDGVALADAGWSVVTLSKGRWSTVARIHTPRDDLSRLKGEGVAEAVAVAVRVLEEMG